MTATIKEIDGARELEMLARDGEIFIDDGRFCMRFDARIFLRAIERELGVMFLDPLESVTTAGS